MIKVAKAALDIALEHLAETGWDIDNELKRLELHRLEYDLPRLRIDHHAEGKHRFFIDRGESYLSEDKQNVFLKHTTMPVIVLEEQNVRALRYVGIGRMMVLGIPVIAQQKQPPINTPWRALLRSTWKFGIVEV